MAHVILCGETVDVREFGTCAWRKHKIDRQLRFEFYVATEQVGPIEYWIFALKGWELRIAASRVAKATEVMQSKHERRQNGEAKVSRCTPGQKRGEWVRS